MACRGTGVRACIIQGRLVLALAAGTGAVLVSSTASAAGEPVRLRVKLDRATLAPGDKARISLELLGRDHHPVINDRERLVTLETLDAGSRVRGRAALAPRQVSLQRGSSCFAAVANLEATAPGRLVIRATTGGLAPGEALLSVVRGHAFLPALLPIAHAQDAPPFELLYTLGPVPVNGASIPSVFLARDDPSEPLVLRVTAEPAVTLRHEERLHAGLVYVTLQEGQRHAQVDLISTDVGTVTVTAQQPRGLEASVDVEFVAPKAYKILLQPDRLSVPAGWRQLGVTLRLGDQHGLPMEAVDRDHVITLSCDNDARVGLPSSGISLPRLSPRRAVQVDLGGGWGGRQPHLMATDQEQGLETAHASITIAFAREALLVFAGLGGVLGGLAYHIYRRGTPELWPTRRRGRIEPGIVGHALFSVLFGVVLYLAPEVSPEVVEVFPQLEARAPAFVLGVLGGFAGVVLLQRLVDRVLPPGPEGRAESGRAGAGPETLGPGAPA